MKRLHPKVFKIPIDKIRMGYYSDKYFTRYVEILKKDNHHPTVYYQFFPRQNATICGIDEALAILKFCTGYYKDEEKARKIFSEMLQLDKQMQNLTIEGNVKEIIKLTEKKWNLRLKLNELWIDKWDEIEVKAVYDGDDVKEGMPILTIEGDPTYFGYLETILLGVIARASSTTTAVKKVVKAANGKPILFFSARFDHYWVQATDGYAALKAGAFGVSTDANADYWGIESMGTIPHALIAAYNGKTDIASIAFDKYMPEHVNRIFLVDWDNDVINTTFEVVKSFYEYVTGKEFILGKTDPAPIIGEGKNKIWGVRFDTSGNLRDKSVVPKDENSFGVCPELVWRARKEFDKVGLNNLKIVVSGGFDENKIELFEKLDVPADVYGVGSKLLKKKIDITADIVEVNGKPCAKVGRYKMDNSHLQTVSKKFWENEH
ncbi:nicotinate phosphoribosyltransferase [Thermosipho affectus]|uniref:nicotinate phosphoribosyltransferase n=1 Tax=Thermosipho affectus TaxID=660294 RepID=A0ABX3IJG1_9BACT|nr:MULTISPECIES: nicotinate phosphoribosyltransferase [Thermosipho]ANQ53108.1 nicotinate phosphoribosyltransferase [Thermosipho sp. 1070]APT71557.1 nicotinate phosphoribosyltransferase [Thermosipho sp. 1063]ONN27976.1 nicotinate phosphoribosyltransferase [Thermosipho affectus]